MKKLSFILTGLLAITSAFAQIRVNNYRMEEMNNWNSSVSLNRQQLDMFRAGITNNNETVMDFKVLMNVEATSYMATFNVRQVAENAVLVNTLLNDRIKEFKTALKELGIKENDVVVEIISQTPIYGLQSFKKLFSKSQNEVPIGFELHKNISVTFTKYDLLNDIVFEASKSEIYDMIKVDYFAKNPFDYYDTMRHAAMNYLKAVESQYKKAGFRIDTFERVLAEKTGTVYPITRYTRYNPISKLSYDKLLKDANTSMTTSFISAPSLYYNPLPFNDFDVVIHSDISRPTIQYTISLQAKFIRKQDPKVVTKTEKQFFMITDDGQVKLIDVTRD